MNLLFKILWHLKIRKNTQILKDFKIRKILNLWILPLRQRCKRDKFAVIAGSDRVRIAIVFVYMVVIAVGVCGNSVVINVVVRNGRLHTSINGFIICLVVSDIVLCTFSLPIQLHYQLTDHWVGLYTFDWLR